MKSPGRGALRDGAHLLPWGDALRALPCYLFTVIPAPYFKKYGKLPGVLAFVDGITAAAIGAITGSVIVIAKRSLIDIPTVLIALATVALLWKFKKLQEPVVVAGAAILGPAIYPLVH